VEDHTTAGSGRAGRRKAEKKGDGKAAKEGSRVGGVIPMTRLLSDTIVATRKMSGMERKEKRDAKEFKIRGNTKTVRMRCQGESVHVRTGTKGG
jgi:hypothetical protein